MVILRVALCAVGLVAATWAFGRPRALGGRGVAASGPGPRGRVTVVIPARDEAASIGGLLADLGSVATELDVVVVDDHSTDATAEVVARVAASRDDVTLVSAPDVPPGWTGKCWACHCGAAGADDGVLVFADADVRLGPGSLDAALADRDRLGGLLSVQPWHEVQRPYERLSALFNAIALMGAGAGSSHPTGTFGPLVITTVDDYRAVGGHASVRGQVVEDLALGRRYREHGLRTDAVSCDRRITFRMYPSGIRQLAEGWTKNFATGAGSTPPLRLLAVVLWIIALGTASFALADGLLGAAPLALGAALYAVVVLHTAILLRRVGRFGLGTAALLPLHLLVFFAIFGRSLWRTKVRRSVTWRDREIPIGPVGG